MYMVYYIPAVRDDENYAPSWTGNYSYPTISIRGIFDSREKAEESIHNWRYENSSDIEIIEEYWFEEDEEDEAEEKPTAFNIDYSYGDLTLYEGNYYKVNECYNEEYSALWDANRTLGFCDY